MTDNEIIKALECCKKSADCKKCPLSEYSLMAVECMGKLIAESKDLIQRQQERIERLKDNLDAVLKERATLDVDRVVAELEAEKYKGMESLEPIKVVFNFGINKALDIVKGVQNE